MYRFPSAGQSRSLARINFIESLTSRQHNACLRACTSAVSEATMTTAPHGPGCQPRHPPRMK